MLNTELATSLILRSHRRHTVTCNAKNANPDSQPQHSGGFILFQQWQNQTAGDKL